MAKSDVLSCQHEAREVVTERALHLCEWHAYEHNHDVGWIGKTDEDDVKYTIPKMKDEGNDEDK